MNAPFDHMAEESPAGQRLTKRQRRILRQQEQRAGRERQAHRGRRIIAWAGLLLLGGFAAWTLMRPPGTDATKMQAKGSVKAAQSGKSVAAIGAGDWTKGNADATVALIEYGDFQCPACGAYYPMVEQIVAEYGDRVRFAFREYPLGSIHPYGNLAAQAAEAAGLQGKFWEMYGLLYDNQRDWSQGSDVKKAFASYASDVGINVDQWQADLNASSVKDKIKKDVASGDAGGVDGTPSFYLNNVKIENPRNVDEFRKVLDAALSP